MGDNQFRDVTKKMLKCPFCGREAKMMIGPDIWIRCNNCGADGPMKGSNEAAIEAWNKRKPIEQIVEQLHEEREESKNFGEACLYDRAYGEVSAFSKAIEIVKGSAE